MNSNADYVELAAVDMKCWICESGTSNARLRRLPAGEPTNPGTMGLSVNSRRHLKIEGLFCGWGNVPCTRKVGRRILVVLSSKAYGGTSSWGLPIIQCSPTSRVTPTSELAQRPHSLQNTQGQQTPSSRHRWRYLLHIMRATSRLLAAVKSASKYLEAHTPTGLTGLTTHPSPRPALVWTYRQTLKKLGQLPKSSVYRQSTEALTKHRLEIVESTKPEGYEQWLERVRKQIEASPKAYGHLLTADGSLASEKPQFEEIDNWDGQITRADALPEGTNDLSQAEHKTKAVEEEIRVIDLEAKEGQLPTVEDLEIEPPLNREQ